MTRGDASQRGFALLIVLWSLALLTLLGTQVLTIGRQDNQLARNRLDAAVLESAANGAVQQAIFGVIDGSAHHWSADGTMHTVRLGRAIVTVHVEDEADKVNPSIASAALLQALLRQLGEDPVTATAVAASIVEWRLASGSPGRPNATTTRYAAAGRDYAPSGAPFASIDELGAVLGMTPELLARLRPHLTLYTDGDPGANTRDPVVARALATAGQLDLNTDQAGEELVSVTASARGPASGRFTLHVVVRLNAKPEGRRYEVLVYERLWDEHS